MNILNKIHSFWHLIDCFLYDHNYLPFASLIYVVDTHTLQRIAFNSFKGFTQIRMTTNDNI